MEYIGVEPPKTNKKMETKTLEDVSPFKNGDFPACHVTLLEGKKTSCESTQVSSPICGSSSIQHKSKPGRFPSRHSFSSLPNKGLCLCSPENSTRNSCESNLAGKKHQPIATLSSSFSRVNGHPGCSFAHHPVAPAGVKTPHVFLPQKSPALISFTWFLFVCRTSEPRCHVQIQFINQISRRIEGMLSAGRFFWGICFLPWSWCRWIFFQLPATLKLTAHAPENRPFHPIGK